MKQDGYFTKAFYELPVSGFPVKVGEMDGSQPFLYGYQRTFCGKTGCAGPALSRAPFPQKDEGRPKMGRPSKEEVRS